MFLIDDLLLMPARGIMAAFREIHNAVQQGSANESEAIRTELSELYMLLETKQLSEAEFDQREKELLDRLDEIEKGAAEAALGIGGDEELDEEDEADEDEAEEDEADEDEAEEDVSEDEYFDGDEDEDEEDAEEDAEGEDDDPLDDEDDEDDEDEDEDEE